MEKRLQTMELLWDSLARPPDNVPSPDWHDEVLGHRMEEVKRGEGEFLTLPELRQRLLQS